MKMVSIHLKLRQTRESSQEYSNGRQDIEALYNYDDHTQKQCATTGGEGVETWTRYFSF
jgi:hypothetical protein